MLNAIWPVTESQTQTHPRTRGERDPSDHTEPEANLLNCSNFSISFATELKCSAVVTDQEARNIFIEWYRDDCLFSHLDYDTRLSPMVVSSIFPSANGNYSCQVADDNGLCLQSQNFTVDWTAGSLVETGNCSKQTTVTKTLHVCESSLSPSSSSTGTHRCLPCTCSALQRAS